MLAGSSPCTDSGKGGELNLTDYVRHNPNLEMVNGRPRPTFRSQHRVILLLSIPCPFSAFQEFLGGAKIGRLTISTWRTQIPPRQVFKMQQQGETPSNAHLPPVDLRLLSPRPPHLRGLPALHHRYSMGRILFSSKTSDMLMHRGRAT
jgi:hypothetical protein